VCDDELPTPAHGGLVDLLFNGDRPSSQPSREVEVLREPEDAVQVQPITGRERSATSS
jgi:hypothetical protein